MTFQNAISLARISDDELLAEVKRLVGSERETTARLVAHLAELDARRLHLGAGFPSLFVYCTAVLRLSENEAYNRIEAARTARRFPVIFELLQDGRLNLTTVRLLAPPPLGSDELVPERVAQGIGDGTRNGDGIGASLDSRRPAVILPTDR